MLKRKKILANEQGFTLIEIIAVLVLLGILAAVAVPKYMDLTGEARKKAAMGGLTELNGRANLTLAKHMLDTSISADTFSNILGDDLKIYSNAATPIAIAESDSTLWVNTTKYRIVVNGDVTNSLLMTYAGATTTSGSETPGNFTKD